MNLTNVFVKNANAKTRYVINQGGTSSSKTFSILQVLYIWATKQQLHVSIVSESMPHLKKGAMRDFFKILQDENSYDDKRHNKTDNIYLVPNLQGGDSIIEFFSADSGDKVRGARRDVLYINECNNVPWSVFDQLEVRTKKRIYLDFNPVASFWAHEKLLENPDFKDQVTFIKSTYRDALDVLDEAIVRAIESRRNSDPEWWRVYGLGEVGNVAGLILTNWDAVDNLPEEYKWRAYGLDFGYTNDPTAIVEVRLSGGELWIRELCYSTGLTNVEISNNLNLAGVLGNIEIYADSAEPKSIDEIYSRGYNIKPATKGADSVKQGIDVLKRYRLRVTKDSTNLIKELRNYKWQEDKNSEQLNKPIDAWNHAIDALRYCVTMKEGVKKYDTYDAIL